MVKEANARLDRAEESHKCIVERNKIVADFLTSSSRCYEAHIEQRCQNSLVQWVLEQVPMIEAELKDAPVVEGSESAGEGTGTKRPHSCDGDDEVSSSR